MPLGSAGFHHPRIRAARLLRQKKHRAKARCFIIEGPILVGAALDAGCDITSIFFRRDDTDARLLAERAAETGAQAFGVDDRTIDTLAQTREPQGIVAVARFLHHQLEALEKFVQPRGPATLLVLHDLADPGNAGTLIRCAEAFAVDAVCIGPSAVEPYNDKAVRATAGALFRVPIVRYDDWGDYAAAARRLAVEIIAAEAGGSDVRSINLPRRAALLVGHERHGLRDIARDDIAAIVAVPQTVAAESLNAAVAGSILLYELARSSGRI